MIDVISEPVQRLQHRAQQCCCRRGAQPRARVKLAASLNTRDRPPRVQVSHHPRTDVGCQQCFYSHSPTYRPLHLLGAKQVAEVNTRNRAARSKIWACVEFDSPGSRLCPLRTAQLRPQRQFAFPSWVAQSTNFAAMPASCVTDHWSKLCNRTVSFRSRQCDFKFLVSHGFTERGTHCVQRVPVAIQPGTSCHLQSPHNTLDQRSTSFRPMIATSPESPLRPISATNSSDTSSCSYGERQSPRLNSEILKSQSLLRRHQDEAKGCSFWL